MVYTGCEYAYGESVFTLSEYHKMGLGKASVLEGVKRCGKRGAKYAIVLSSQQFYYFIGYKMKRTKAACLSS